MKPLSLAALFWVLRITTARGTAGLMELSANPVRVFNA